jgi:hypothetical protein
MGPVRSDGVRGLASTAHDPPDEGFQIPHSNDANDQIKEANNMYPDVLHAPHLEGHTEFCWPARGVSGLPGFQYGCDDARASRQDRRTRAGHRLRAKSAPRDALICGVGGCMGLYRYDLACPGRDEASAAF